MAALTDYAKTQVLNALLHGDALGAPGQWYYALYVTTEDGSESATECTDANYERKAVDFNAESGGASTNDGALLFDAFATPQSISGVGLCDAPTGGHKWLYQNLLVAAGFSAGESARIGDASQIVSAT